MDLMSLTRMRKDNRVDKGHGDRRVTVDLATGEERKALSNDW